MTFFINKQKYPDTVVGCVHWSMVGTAVLGVLELAIIGVMIANLFPFETCQMGKGNYSFFVLNSMAKPVTE